MGCFYDRDWALGQSARIPLYDCAPHRSISQRQSLSGISTHSPPRMCTHTTPIYVTSVWWINQLWSVCISCSSAHLTPGVARLNTFVDCHICSCEAKSSNYWTQSFTHTAVVSAELDGMNARPLLTQKLVPASDVLVLWRCFEMLQSTARNTAMQRKPLTCFTLRVLW